MKIIDVELGARSYPIYIGSDLLASGAAQEYLKSAIHGSQVTIVTNETIAPLYLGTLESLLEEYQVHSVVLKDGESFKNLDTMDQIFSEMLAARQNRTTTLVALGGGVIGDMTGFAAASYQRGVNFVQVPTTLLSQVDSSVGGKTGVNHKLGKNMIGAFKQPQAVIVDLSTLKTLDSRQFAAGMAEVVKYGLIWDSEFFDWIESNIDALVARDTEALEYAIAKSCEIKAAVVAEDETEKSLRAILNLGHTFGHAMETYGNYSGFLHGEGVAAGMVMACDLSDKMGWISSNAGNRLRVINSRLGLPNNVPAGMTKEDFMTNMAVDKKNLGDEIRLVLLSELGKAVVTTEYEVSKLETLIEEFCNHNPG